MGSPDISSCEVKMFAAGLQSRLIETKDQILQHTITRNYSEVLVIVTGGTLTMINTDHGYVSLPGLAKRLKTNEAFYDSAHAKEIDLADDWLVTPPTVYRTRIKFKVLEFEKLIDSSNIETED
jgi:hypothetical protein